MRDVAHLGGGRERDDPGQRAEPAAGDVQLLQAGTGRLGGRLVRHRQHHADPDRRLVSARTGPGRDRGGAGVHVRRPGGRRPGVRSAARVAALEPARLAGDHQDDGVAGVRHRPVQLADAVGELASGRGRRYHRKPHLGADHDEPRGRAGGHGLGQALGPTPGGEEAAQVVDEDGLVRLRLGQQSREAGRVAADLLGGPLRGPARPVRRQPGRPLGVVGVRGGRRHVPDRADLGHQRLGQVGLPGPDAAQDEYARRHARTLER